MSNGSRMAQRTFNAKMASRCSVWRRDVENMQQDVGPASFVGDSAFDKLCQACFDGKISLLPFELLARSKTLEIPRSLHNLNTQQVLQAFLNRWWFGTMYYSFTFERCYIVVVLWLAQLYQILTLPKIKDKLQWVLMNMVTCKKNCGSNGNVSDELLKTNPHRVLNRCALVFTQRV